MMQQLTVASLARDIKFEGFLLVRSAEQRTSSNGGKYLDMTLCDTTGDINCKMWDGTVQPPRQGSVVKVRGTVQEYNGRLQMRVERLRAPAPGDPTFPLDALARHLGVTADDDDIIAAIKKAGMEDIKGTLEQFRSEGRLPGIREAIRRSKAVDWLVDNVSVTVSDEIAERRANQAEASAEADAAEDAPAEE